MKNKNTYYQRNEETLLERAKKYYEIVKKGQKNKEKISIGNYLTKNKTLKDNMEEIDIKICMKKTNKN